MKRFLLLSAAAVITAATVNAQTVVTPVKHDMKILHKEDKVIRKEIRKEKKELRKLEGKKVSYQSKAAFSVDFGNIPNATWTRGTYYDEVTFINKHGKTVTAYYDYDADLVGTTMHKNFTDIPAKAQKYINEKYSGYNKEAVIFFHDNQLNETDMVLYNNPFEDADNYFVALKKGNDEIIVQVDTAGSVSFFKKI
jgi:hypothetical protein